MPNYMRIDDPKPVTFNLSKRSRLLLERTARKLSRVGPSPKTMTALLEELIQNGCVKILKKLPLGLD
jgi:hypothetical protein